MAKGYEKPGGYLEQKKLGSVKDLIGNAAEARGYLSWREIVPTEIRRLVEGHLIGTSIFVGRDHLPLKVDFLKGLNILLENPDADVASVDLDERVKNKLKKMQKVDLGNDSFVNIFSILKNPDVDFGLKSEWFEAQMKSRLEWLEDQDVQAQKEAEEFSDLELTPDKEEQNFQPSMDEQEGSKERLKEGLFEIRPFFGGYYRKAVCEEWNKEKMEWKPAKATGLEELPEVLIQEEKKRFIFGKTIAGQPTIIPLPYSWAVKPQTLTIENLPDGAQNNIQRDENGFVRLLISGVEGNFIFKIEAGPTEERSRLGNSSEEFAQMNNFPSELGAIIEEKKSGAVNQIALARLIVAAVRSQLEYSSDSSYNNIYWKNPQECLSLIWKEKKADCDVANTLAVAVLRKAGLNARLAIGYYVKDKTENNSTVLHNGQRHAWLEVWDEEEDCWVRLDATPDGDPNLDEEEQERDLSGEGDYGEQEHQDLDEEEIKKMAEDLEKEEKERQRAPVVKYAEEAGCSVEEARHVLGQIERARGTRDKEGRLVLKEMERVWLTAVRKNKRDVSVYRGPVRRSEGEILDDPVSTYIDSISGERDPSGFEKEFAEERTEKYFGGFEVYVAADMSASMGWVDEKSGQVKSKAQRDCVFLFVDSIMSAAGTVIKNQKHLRAPMPVGISVLLYQGKKDGPHIKVVLPMTENWGPKEQINLYRSLDEKVGGGTPDDKALEVIKEQIENAKKDEEKLKPRGKKDWKTHRFVTVFADGESDSSRRTKKLLSEIRGENTVVYGLGVTDSASEMKNIYGSDCEIVPSAADLAAVGLSKLVEKLKIWYDLEDKK